MILGLPSNVKLVALVVINLLVFYCSFVCFYDLLLVGLFVCYSNI